MVPLTNAQIEERSRPHWEWITHNTSFSNVIEVSSPAERTKQATAAASPQRSASESDCGEDNIFLHQYLALLQVIAMHGDEKLSSGEMYKRAGIRGQGTGQKRQGELEAMGLIEISQGASSPKGGRPRTLLRITDKGRVFLKKHAKPQP